MGYTCIILACVALFDHGVRSMVGDVFSYSGVAASLERVRLTPVKLMS